MNSHVYLFLGKLGPAFPQKLPKKDKTCAAKYLSRLLFFHIRPSDAKKPFHRFVLFFDWSLSLVPATEWCNKNMWLHTWFSRKTLLKIVDFSSVSTSSREIDENVIFSHIS